MKKHRPEDGKLNRRRKVVIHKDEPLDLEFLSAIEKTLSEWNSESDDKAYGGLQAVRSSPLPTGEDRR
jgi:hypothetical protein